MTSKIAAIEQWRRAVEPPLRYLATARPKHLAANALPTERILSLIEEVAREDATNREALGRLRALFTDFPLGEEAARHQRAVDGLREIELLKQGPATAAAAPPTTYRATEGDVAAA